VDPTCCAPVWRAAIGPLDEIEIEIEIGRATSEERLPALHSLQHRDTCLECQRDEHPKDRLAPGL